MSNKEKEIFNSLILLLSYCHGEVGLQWVPVTVKKQVNIPKFLGKLKSKMGTPMIKSSTVTLMRLPGKKVPIKITCSSQ